MLKRIFFPVALRKHTECRVKGGRGGVEVALRSGAALGVCVGVGRAGQCATLMEHHN